MRNDVTMNVIDMYIYRRMIRYIHMSICIHLHKLHICMHTYMKISPLSTVSIFLFVGCHSHGGSGYQPVKGVRFRHLRDRRGSICKYLFIFIYIFIYMCMYLCIYGSRGFGFVTFETEEVAHIFSHCSALFSYQLVVIFLFLCHCICDFLADVYRR
jgi:hypothetical protein